MKPHLDTRAVHAGVERDSAQGAAVTPIARSTVYEQSTAATYHDMLYPRLSTLPNQVQLAHALADLEGGEAALVTASGMAAISTTLLSVLAGDGHLIAHRALYGGTHSLLTQEFAELGLSVSFIDATDPTGWQQALRSNTRAIYVEALTNPLLELAAHDEVVAFAKANRLLSIIDSTFATPVVFRPLQHGFDIVVHSATKYLNGHSDVAAGCIVGAAAQISKIKTRLDHLGACLDPQAAYLLHRGLKTLGLRVRRQNESAGIIARYLVKHPAVAKVRYPGLPEDPSHARAVALFEGFGAMLAVDLKGGEQAAADLVHGVRTFINSASLGGVESLVTRPATTSHSGMSAAERAAAGISDGLVRISVGIEHPDDLIADLEQALA